MKQLHNIQIQILKKLLFTPSRRYSLLKPKKDMDNNQFNFHLETLIQSGYVVKLTNEYSLTTLGKEFANRIDEKDNMIILQAKISVMLCVINGDEDKQYLIYTRLKHPFFGCQGFLTGKISYGETVIETAIRELKEETNLDGLPQLVGIKHFRVFDKNTDNLIEDKFLYFCKIQNPQGELKANNEGKFEWVRESNLKSYMTNPFVSFEDIMKYINEVRNFKGNISFDEIDSSGDKF